MAQNNSDKTMSKRPLEETPLDQTHKKPRKNDELEAMKAQLEAMLASAAEHHEEMRISVVDEAYDMEEQLKGMTEVRDELKTTLAEVTVDFETAAEYLQHFEASQTAQMLQKAAESKLEHVKVLQIDKIKITKTLEKLKTFKQTMKTKQDEVATRVQELENKCKELTSKFEAAEQLVEEITNLNENHAF